MLNKFIFMIVIIIFNVAPLLSIDSKALKFNKEVHDFGRIKQNQRVTTTFTYTNKSSKSIKIQKIQTSCGCTAANTTKDILKPGEYAAVTISFNSGRRKGQTKKYIYFSTVPPLQPRPQIAIRANIVPEVYLEPERIYGLELDKIVSPIIKTAKILTDEHPDFEINRLTYDPNTIKVEQEKLSNDKNKQYGYSLRITIYPKEIIKKFTGRYFTETIRIETSIKSAPVLNLSIQGTTIHKSDNKKNKPPRRKPAR